MPALPLEARTIKEADGTSGLRSLSILSVISLAIAFRRWRGQNTGDATDDDFALVNTLLGEDPTDDENV